MSDRWEIQPITKTVARAFVEKHHRHNEAPTNMQVSLWTGLFVDDELVAVVTAGYPVARGLNDGRTLEVNRVCVNGDQRNANSALYGAIGRAAKALGWHRLVTYTLESESGASLRGAGFTDMDHLAGRSWQDSSGSETRVRYDENLFGERRQAQNQPKIRWERQL